MALAVCALSGAVRAQAADAAGGVPDFPFTLLNTVVNGKLGKDAFTFAHITDLHIGEGEKDYGTEGYDDAPPAADSGVPARRLKEAVDWINANKDARNIAFVIVTGDITDSAEKSEFMKAKELLDALTIPYIPVPGNHDIWPYTAPAEAPAPLGDEYFKDIFAPVFEGLKAKFSGWDDGTRLTRTFDNEHNVHAYFQNFSFDYRGYRFLFADFNARAHAPVRKKGIGPEAELHDIEDGTMRWLRSRFEGYKGGPGRLLLFAHHPLTGHLPRTETYPGAGGFPQEDLRTVISYLSERGIKGNMGLWAAGHTHKNREYTLKAVPRGAISPCVETGAVKEGHLRLFEVRGAL